MTPAREPGLSLYLDYVARAGDRLSDLRAIARWRRFERVLYPGAYVHVTPSLVFPRVTYNDTDRRTPAFFADDAVLQFIREHREYAEEPEVRFWHGSYTELPGPGGAFDLLISQYAGPVSQACAPWLARGGVLYANDSHGDASLAHFDERYEFIGVVDEGVVDTSRLDEYFQPRGRRTPTRESVLSDGRGPRYRVEAAGYLFVHL
ncbi:MAG: hypothetical protein AB7F65_06405 [Dehalococcoidia bacterium]